MTKCLPLLKIQLMSFFNINSLRFGGSREKRRAALMGFAILLVAAALAGYSAALSFGLAVMGMVDIVPPLMLMVCAAVTLVLTFLKSNGVLFGFRDYDMVMSLPVKSSEVIASRLISVYIMDLVVTCVALIPSMIVYAYYAEAALSVWVMMISSLFLAPLLPIIVAMAAGAAIAAVSARFRYKNLITILLSVAAIVALMLLSTFGAPMSDAQLAEMGESISHAVTGAYPPAAMYRDALVNMDWLSFGRFAAVSVVPTALFIALLSAFYTKINSVLFSRHSRSDYRVGTLKTSTPFKALYSKELRRLFSCSMYFMNSCIGVVLLVLIAVAVNFTDLAAIEAAMGIPNFAEMCRNAGPLLVCIIVSMSSTTSSSISLEGKSRWIPASMPVTPALIFNSKIAVNLTVNIPAVLISGVLLAVGLHSGPLDIFFLIVTPCVYSYFIAVAGLAYNMKFPKYDWTSEYHAVKQSVSVLATLGTGMVVSLIPFALAIVLSDYAAIVTAATTVVMLIITWMIHKGLMSKRGMP